DRRNDRVGRQHFGYSVGLADAAQAGYGQDQGDDLAAVQLGQSGIDVAPHRRELQLRPVPGQLRLPSHRAGTHRGAGRQVGEFTPVRGDHAVLDVLAIQVRGEDQAVWDRHVTGDVLQAVHRDVDLTVEQRPVDLTNERALATSGGQRPHPPVAVRGDHDQ